MKKVSAAIPAVLLLAAANLILTTVFTYLALYWLFPLLCNLIPPLNVYYAEMSDERFYLAYENIRSICAVLSIYPAAVILRFYTPRKKAFQSALRDGPGVKASRKAYRQTLFKEDCIASALLLGIWFILFLVAPTGIILRLFPFAEVLLNRFHIVGLILGSLLVPPALLWGTYSAQNVWRAEFHLGL